MDREVIEISNKIAPSPSLLNQQEKREREEKRRKLKFQRWNTIGYAGHDIMLT